MADQHPDQLAQRAAVMEAHRLVGALDQLWRTAIARSHYADEWEAYRAHERGEQWPLDLELCWRAHHDATHRYYLLRDGPNGVLGGRGL